ncbi:MAG: PcfJ domain-containing protein [Pirellulales bacterium]|nr:PcfJ domain-containing protein [Pirellulales bacterium]
MQWSQLRKRVQDMFADSVKGRVQLRSTGYRKFHDGDGRYWITVDGEEIVNIPHWYQWYMRDYMGQPNLSKEFSDYVSLFAKGGLGLAMNLYLTMSIDDILCSENVLVQAIGMLDRRVGKRRLRTLELKNSHPLVRLFHNLRCEAEGIHIADAQKQIGNLNLRHPVWPNTLSKGEKKEKRRRAAARLDDAKKTRKRRPLLARIHRGEFTKEELDTGISAEIHAGFEQATDRDAFLATLRLIESKSKLLKSATHARGVVELCKDASDWIRPIDQWTPKSHNPDRQFSSLARHLRAVYDVPLFMDKAWLQGTALQQAWFKHIGRGKNIQTAEGLPIPLTKKMAHHFLEAPATYSIEAAFRWGQAIALGGDRWLVDALRETRLVEDFRDNEFWLSVIRFFVRNPMLDPVHINPIIDYIWNQRYEPRIAFVERGVAREVGPEQPNLSMRCRTVASLLRAVDEWHRRLGRETSGGRLQWRKSAFRDFEFIEGSVKSKNMKIWRIRELLGSQELITEGRRMCHCVASYSNSCYKGLCSIWSMDVETDDGIEPLVTVEVNHQRNEICQIRGKRNRLPIDKEKDILQRWALEEKLRTTILAR